MDFTYDEAESAVAELARKIFTDRVTADTLRAFEQSGATHDAKLWGELAAAGLVGTALPEDQGGSGHGLVALLALLVEVGASLAPVPVWSTLVASALPIAQFGSPSQRALLGRVAQGEALTSAAFVDEASDDPWEPATRATPEGNGFRVSSVKTCVALADEAARILVTARAPSGRAVLLLVDPRAAGVRLEEQRATTGERLSRMTLTDALVPEADVLAGEDRGDAALAWTLDRALVGLCALELGVVERALRMTAAYATTRHQFDRPIGTFQAVSQRAGDAYIDVEVVRLSLWHAAYRLAAGLPASREVLIAKWAAADAGHRVVYAAQHLHGGMGFDRDYPLHRYYLASKHVELLLGSASRQLARLGASLAEA